MFHHAYIGKYVGFYHHDLSDEKVKESFERKFKRFHEKINKNKCVFLRTIATVNASDELRLYKDLQKAIDTKYPNKSYIICFIIPNQPLSQYCKNLDQRTFLFTLNDISIPLEHLRHSYKPIYDFIVNENLFETIPNSSGTSINDYLTDNIWMFQGRPMVHSENETSI